MNPMSSNPGAFTTPLNFVLSILQPLISMDSRIHAILFGLAVLLVALLLQQRRGRKRVTRDFQCSERKYRELVENAIDAIYEHDLQGNLLGMNRAGERLCGYPHADIIGMNIARLIHPDDRERLGFPGSATGFAKLSRRRVLEVRLRHRNGHTVFVEIRARLIRTADGSIVVQGIARDVTDRKVMEGGRAVLLQIARIQDEVLAASDMIPRVLQTIGESGIWDVCGFWDASRSANDQLPSVWPLAGLTTLLQHHPTVRDTGIDWQTHPGVPVQTIVTVPVRAGKLPFGAFVLLAVEERPHSQLHASILEDIAHRTALFFERELEREELRRSEERFRSAFRDSAIGMALVAVDGSIQQVNPALCRMLGYSEAELLQLDSRAITHPDDRATDMALRAELLAGVRPNYELGKRYLHKNDHTVWGHLGVSALRDARQNPIGFICQVIDESQRKRDELALQRSEQRYRSLFERNLSAVIRCTPQGGILDCNDALARLVGRRYREDLLHQSLLDYCVDPEEFFELVEILNRGESVLNYEIHLRRWTGREICGLASLSLFEKDDGAEVTIEGTVIDITERKQDEEELARLSRQMQLILNSAGEGICGLDRNGIITFANPAAATMTGWTVDELLGANLHNRLHERQAEDADSSLDRCAIVASMIDGQKHQTSDEVFWRKDGTSFPVEFISTPICSDRGEILGAVVVFQDISQRRAIERMKNEFVSVVSHELRTPLTAIRGSLGLLASGRLGTLAPQARHMLDIGVTNTDRLIRLINNILDVERLDSGRIVLQLQPCSIESLISQAVAAIAPLAEKEDIRIESAPCPATVHADPDRVVQTLTNLLGNAIKFSPRNSTIRVSVEVSGNEVVFAVQDHGRGIPAEKLESIFERFEQVDASDSRKKGGSGLGLAISRSIVKQHGGRIWVESTPGVGSTFYFTLPAAPASPPSPHATDESALHASIEAAPFQ